MNLDDLIERARSLAAGTDRRVLLGIAGSPGAGKSTLAAVLRERLGPVPPAGLPSYAWVTQVPMDGFHLADAELVRLGRRDRKGAPDTFDADGYAALLARLRDPAAAAQTIYAPGFERDLDQPIAGQIPVGPEVALVITEGNYLLLEDRPWVAVRAQLDQVWFCATAEDRRMTQLVARHAAFGKSVEQARTWAAGPDQRNAERVRASADRADLVVPESLLAALPPR